MLELKTVRSPLDPSATLVNMNMTKEELHESQMKTTKKIMDDAMFYIIQNTLTSDTPETTFRYSIPEEYNTKEMFRDLKDMMYKMFRNNMYTMPYISFTDQSAEGTNTNYISIDAEATVKSILNSDKRINTTIKNLIESNLSNLEEGKTIVFDGLNISAFELPDMYIQSRAKYIMNVLYEKKYNCEFDDKTNYISITYIGEKQ